MNCIIDYVPSKKCCNEENLYGYTCYKCGKCGRVFEDGFLVDENDVDSDEKEVDDGKRS